MTVDEMDDRAPDEQAYFVRLPAADAYVGRTTPSPVQPSAGSVGATPERTIGAALLVAGGLAARRAPSFDEYSAALAIVPQADDPGGEPCPKELCEGHPVDSGERQADPAMRNLQYTTSPGPRCWSTAPDGTLLARGEPMHKIQHRPWASLQSCTTMLRVTSFSYASTKGFLGSGLSR